MNVYIKCLSGTVLCHTRSSSEEDVDSAVQSARTAYCQWSQTSGMERGKLLYEAARIVRVCDSIINPASTGISVPLIFINFLISFT